MAIDFSNITLNFDYGGLNDFPNYLKDADILIDTTPIGMYPHENDQPVATEDILHSDLIVNDIVYNPLETTLIKEAKKASATTITGDKMLLYQGAENFKIWTQKEAPIDIMGQALLEMIEKK